MVFGVRDMAAFAEKRAAEDRARAPDWNYTNGNTLLLSGCIRDNAGGDAGVDLAFARRELFDKLGMRHVTLEFDAVGTPIGSSHMLASARDWARSACSHLNDGVVGGERLLRRRLGRLFGGADAGQRDASAMARASGPTAATGEGQRYPHRARHPGRRLLRPRCERAVRHHRALAAAWSWCASAPPSRRATTWMSWRAWWPT